jgi:hypothetical protein
MAANVLIIGGHHVLALQSPREGWQATSLLEGCREHACRRRAHGALDHIAHLVGVIALVILLKQRDDMAEDVVITINLCEAAWLGGVGRSPRRQHPGLDIARVVDIEAVGQTQPQRLLLSRPRCAAAGKSGGVAVAGSLPPLSPPMLTPTASIDSTTGDYTVSFKETGLGSTPITYELTAGTADFTFRCFTQKDTPQGGPNTYSTPNLTSSVSLTPHNSNITGSISLTPEMGGPCKDKGLKLCLVAASYSDVTGGDATTPLDFRALPDLAVGSPASTTQLECFSPTLSGAASDPTNTKQSSCFPGGHSCNSILQCCSFSCISLVPGGKGGKSVCAY